MNTTTDAPVIELFASDLPVHCPNPSMTQWSSHPRVFIKLIHGEGKCPYCGTVYRLKAGEKVAYH